MTSSLEPLMGIWPNSTGLVPDNTKSIQMVLIVCISRSLGQKLGFQMQFSKIFLSETTMPRAFM